MSAATRANCGRKPRISPRSSRLRLLRHARPKHLCRASTSCLTFGMAGGWVYFMTNKRDGTLYCGVTSMLPKRAYEHREGFVDGFTKEHGLKRLVYYERHD